MKKIILLLLVSIFIISCGNHFFNPRYYYNKSTSSSSDSNTPTDTTPDKEPDYVPEDQDPFKKFTDENAGGYPASKFDSWLFKSSFRNSKLPDYKFFEDSSRQWQMGQDWNYNQAYYYLANSSDNNTASGFAISDMKIYKYKENPLYASSGYLAGRMDRFRFYSIDGVTGLSIVTVPLKQYLIAVDTYSKFVFAFGKITSIDTVAGEKVPKTFEAVEKHGDYDFYEYDPIGYVQNDGTVILYEHYQTEFVQNPTSYFPKVHPQFDKVAEYSAKGAGRSPYYIELDNGPVTEEDINKFDEAIKLVSSEYKWRDYSGYNSTDPSSKSQIADLDSWVKNYSGRSLTLYTYKFEDVNDASGNIVKGKLTIKTEVFGSQQTETKVYARSAVTSSTKATYTNISNSNDTISIVLVEGQNNVIVSGVTLDSSFVDYGPVFADRVRNARFKRSGEISIGGGIGGIASSTFPLSSGGKLKDLEYTFNADGTEFTMSYQYDDAFWPWQKNWVSVSYKFKLARFDGDSDKHWTAKYECLDLSGKLGKYTRVVLRNDGQLIRSSMTLHALEGAIDLGITTIPDDPNSDLGLEMVADKQ